MRRRIVFCLIISIILNVFSGCGLKEKVLETLEPEMNDEHQNQNRLLPDTISLALENAASLNPYDMQAASNLQAFRLLYEPLFSYDENMRVIPVLAESYSVSNGGLTAVVRIKDGIKCHDGSNLTGLDVLHSVNQLLTKQTPYSHNVIQRAELKDRQTVEFTFTKPQMNAKEQLMFPVIKMDGNSVFGTGAYKYVNKGNTDTFVFSQFEEYHGEKPYIKNIKMINSPDFESVGRLFEIGETDILTSDAFDYSTFNVKSDMSVYDYPKNEFVYIGINFDKVNFWGESTRQALNYVIDKNEIVDKVLYKKATVANFPINPKSWLYPKDKDTKKDTAYAEELMLKDSWTRVDGVFARMVDGKRQDFEINILVLDDEEMISVAEIIEKNLDNFGIKANTVIKGESEYWSMVANKEYDLLLNRTELPASADFESLTGEGNVFGYLNSTLNELVGSIRLQQDENVLKDSYAKCCDIFLKDMQFITLFFYKDAVVTGADISDNVICSEDNPFYNISAWNRP